MKITNVCVGLFLLILLLPGWLLAAEVGDDYLQIERSKQTDMGLRTTLIGGIGFKNKMVGHGGLSYIESVDNGDALALDIGAGAAFHAGVTFFVGGGFLLGYNWDNSDYIGAYYPEVGVVARVSGVFGMMVTGKRYYNLYDGAEDENVLMLSLLFGGG